MLPRASSSGVVTASVVVAALAFGLVRDASSWPAPQDLQLQIIALLITILLLSNLLRIEGALLLLLPPESPPPPPPSPRAKIPIRAVTAAGPTNSPSLSLTMGAGDVVVVLRLQGEKRICGALLSKMPCLVVVNVVVSLLWLVLRLIDPALWLVVSTPKLILGTASARWLVHVVAAGIMWRRLDFLYSRYIYHGRP